MDLVITSNTIVTASRQWCHFESCRVICITSYVAQKL